MEGNKNRQIQIGLINGSLQGGATEDAKAIASQNSNIKHHSRAQSEMDYLMSSH